MKRKIWGVILLLSKEEKEERKKESKIMLIDIKFNFEICLDLEEINLLLL